MLLTYNFTSVVLPAQILPLYAHLIYYCVKTNQNFMAIQSCPLLILYQSDFIYKAQHLKFINRFYRHPLVPPALLIITVTLCLVCVVNTVAYQALGNCVAHHFFIFTANQHLKFFAIVLF